MKNEYLRGINRIPSDFPSIERIGIGDDYWYAVYYETVKAKKFSSIKETIVNMVKHYMTRNTKYGDWDWHHVVETEHMAQILSKSDLYYEAWKKMPTVLIHKPEHIDYSRNFNNKESRELAMIRVGWKSDFSENEPDKVEMEGVSKIIFFYNR